MAKPVVVMGSLNYDYIIDVDRLPYKGESMPANGVQTCGGGKGANQAVQCAKLGLATYMAGAVGGDPMGDALLEGLRDYGVDVCHVKRSGLGTGFAIVHSLRDGAVHATVVRGANFDVAREDIDRLRPLLREAGMLVLQLESPVPVVEYAIQAAKECGCRVLLNAAPAEPISEEALARCDILVMNETETSFYVNAPIETRADAEAHVPGFAKRLGVACVVTLGKNGALLCDSGGTWYFPAYDTPAVETTGAGDSFVGGLAWALENGMELPQAMAFASCCSGVTITGVGAQSSMPDLRQANALMPAYQAQLG